MEGGSGEGQIELRRHHLPALDGLRAVAVCAVMAYHLGFGWAGGGYLGVDLFFVLSGFLITSLLIEERSATGMISLRRFWSRRAHRLFPALLIMLGAVALYANLGGPGVNLQTLRGDIVATLLYFANWHFIASNNSYFTQFLAPSPLEHTWSLAIEEQFYVAWPPLVLLFAKVGGRNWRRIAIAGTAALALASALDMAILARDPNAVTRVYFGTDTRVFELMVGAMLAFWTEGPYRLPRVTPQTLHRAGIVGACALLAGLALLGGPPHWMFEGGFLVIAILAGIVIASVTQANPGPLGALLSLRPIRWVGTISYGLYLWHWPVFVLVTANSRGIPGWAVTVTRVTFTFVLATVSFYVVEKPIRQRGFQGLRDTVAVGSLAVAALALALALETTPAAVAGAYAPPPSPPISGQLFAIAKPPTPAHPLRVMFIGDSVMEFAVTGLQAALQSTGVIHTTSMAYPGWGLTTDKRWKLQLRDRITRFKPNVVMGTWSWDKTAAATHPTAYRKLLDKALAVILAPGDGVQGMIFLQFPPVGTLLPHIAQYAAGSKAIDRSLDAWNTIVASEAAARPRNIGYLPVAASIELDGQFATWLPNANGLWVRVRSIDAFHLCPAGTARYSEAVLADLQAKWGLPAPTAKWWTEPWTHDALYYYGGICPNDHPPHR